MMLGLASRGFCGKDLRSSRRSLELSRGVSRAGSHRAPRAHARRIRPACAPLPHPHIHIPLATCNPPHFNSEPLHPFRTWETRSPHTRDHLCPPCVVLLSLLACRSVTRRLHSSISTQAIRPIKWNFRFDKYKTALRQRGQQQCPPSTPGLTTASRSARQHHLQHSRPNSSSISSATCWTAAQTRHPSSPRSTLASPSATPVSVSPACCPGPLRMTQWLPHTRDWSACRTPSLNGMHGPQIAAVWATSVVQSIPAIS